MNKFAKICRIITVPTLLFFVTLSVTYFVKPDYFVHTYELIIPMVFIGVIPLVSYVVSFILRKLKGQNKDEGRKTQRRLAFIFSFTGYAGAFIIGIVLNFNSHVNELTCSYFLTVLFLTIFNVCRVKASGHAAGIVGPMLLLCHYVGWIYIVPCIAFYALSFWSSVYLKRHTVAQFLTGTLCAAVAFITAVLLF